MSDKNDMNKKITKYNSKICLFEGYVWVRYNQVT